MPWATDLLPYEIDLIKKQLPSIKKEHRVSFVGSKWGGAQGNFMSLNFLKGPAGNMVFHLILLPRLILMSILPMSKRLSWLLQFKAAGNVIMGIYPVAYSKILVMDSSVLLIQKQSTNYSIKKLFITQTAIKLFYDAVDRIPHVTLEQQYELMDFVRDKHTYINRIDDLLKILKIINDMTNAHNLIWHSFNQQMEPLHEFLRLNDIKM